MLNALLTCLAVAGVRFADITLPELPIEGSLFKAVKLRAFSGAFNVSFAKLSGNFVGACRNCGAGNAVTKGLRVLVTAKGQEHPKHALLVGDRILVTDDGICTVNCRGCGARLKLKKVVGKIGRDHECNDKCLSAKGPSCECRCRGANHGAGHLGLPLEAAAAPSQAVAA
jgi:hypothetical protein